MKSIDQLFETGEKLSKYAKSAGATEAQITISSGNEFNVEIREGNIEKLVEAGSRSLAMKVIVDNRVARASSSDLDMDTLKQLMSGAVERARLSSKDPFAGLPEKENITVQPESLEIYDPNIPELSPNQKIKDAKEVERIALSDDRIKKSHGSGYSTYSGKRYLFNTHGFAESYAFTNCSLGVYLQTGSGENLFDQGWYDSSRNLENLMSPEAIAKKAVHCATRLIGARKVASQNVPVVMEPEMTGSFLRFLFDCIKGRNIYMKQSFLVDRLHEKIAGSHVTVIDDGLIPRAGGTRPFDAEGVPTRKTPVIEKGVLSNFLLDTYAAKKLDMQSTGNASGANNFYLQAGEHSQDEIIQSVKNGFLLTDTIGQGRVTTTGDISQGAFGLWIENGELTYPVAEITISGNLGEILQQIEMIGNDLEFKQSIEGPTIKVAEMSIGGS